MANYNLTHTWQQVDDSAELAVQTDDFIVEQGESGIWTYRKWNSGIAECWGRHSFQSKVESTWGELFESDSQSVSYPSGLFKSGNTPIVTATGTGTTWSCMLETSGRGSNTTTPTFYAVRAAAISSAAVEFNINIKAVGLWK